MVLFSYILSGADVQAVASRVAEEMGVKLGEEVGYTIRFENLTNTVILLFKSLSSQLFYILFCFIKRKSVCKC